MTDKQRQILSKYLNECNMKKLLNMDRDIEFNISKNFIDLIFHMRWYHPVAGEMCSIPFFEGEPDIKIKKKIESIVNEDRIKFGLLGDEYAYVDQKIYFDDQHAWYVIKQTWVKGASDTLRTNIMPIKYSDKNDACLPFEGIYNELFDMKIYSIVDLVKFYYSAAQKLR